MVFVIRGYCSSPKLIEFGCFFRVRIISLIEFEFEKGFGISSLDLLIELEQVSIELELLFYRVWNCLSSLELAS